MRLVLAFFFLSSVLPSIAQSAAPVPDYSGMYSFLREGEYIQISVENNGQVTGFISRYGDSDANKNSFVEQFLQSGKLNGDHLSFTTKQMNGISFSFDGTIGRGPGKTTEDEGYCVIRGTLIRLTTDAAKKTTQQTNEVEFKSFPK